ncbi:hypothetical protein MRB53_010837 [Persea americana]|uniref:Uncharacterized protein n=1 Tax=Persea americana TaxID=3435 RepID=A0ACC2LT24_PERAE|nr:hypothetical protein MRB53_010837 [Persea americana]
MDPFCWLHLNHQYTCMKSLFAAAADVFLLLLLYFQGKVRRYHCAFIGCIHKMMFGHITPILPILLGNLVVTINVSISALEVRSPIIGCL